MNKKGIKNLINIIFITILLTVGLFIFFKPIITSGFKYSQSDSGDTILNNFFLEHSFKSIFNPQYLGNGWSSLFFYPQQKAMAYGDILWGSAPIYWLARAFFTPGTAFQLWMIIVSILNFLSFYLLARNLKINTWFAGFGSFLFAFCIPRSIQIGHQQLLPQFYSVLALLFFIKFIDQKKFKYFILFAVFIYLQLLAGIYLGWFFVLAILILILTTCFYYRDKTIFKLFFNFKTLAVWVVLAILLIATFFPYYQAQQEVGRRPYTVIQTMLPRVNSYLSIISDSLLYKFYPDKIKTANEKLPMRGEHYLFLGLSIYLILVISIVAFIFIRKKSNSKYPWPPIFIISLTVFFFITLISLVIPSTSYSLWINVYNFVPGAGAIRAITRIWTISYLFLFLAVALLVSTVYQATKSKILKISLLTLALLSCLEQINLKPYYFDKLKEQKIQEQIDTTIYNLTANNKVDAFYIRWSEGEREFYDYQIKAMWTSLNLNIPTINGYSGKEPLGYQSSRNPMSNEQIISWINYINKKTKPTNILVLDSSIKNDIFYIDKIEIIETELNKCEK